MAVPPARPRIDLFSDTVTRPTEAMRAAIASAEVGDEQLREDPTTAELERRSADLLGMESALFLPSGTMCNQAAYATHCRSGDEILLHRTAHAIHYEGGATSAISGAQLQPLEGARGVFGRVQLEAALRDGTPHQPRSRLVNVEQTANGGGGTAWTLDELAEVREVSAEHGLALHMDGARLPNAAARLGVPMADVVRGFDSAWFDLSKGLGAPVGAVLAGSAGFIADARWWKQRLGGAMRQSGMIAAAGLHALDHHLERLVDDHDNARALVAAIADVPGLVDADGAALRADGVDTNIVIFDIADTGLTAASFLDRLLVEHGVRLSDMGGTHVRAVTHLDVTAAEVAEAAGAIRAVLGAG